MKTFLAVAVYLAIVGTVDLGGALVSNLRSARELKPASAAVQHAPGQTR